MSYTEGLTSAFGVGPQNALASAQAEQQSFQNLQQQRVLGALASVNLDDPNSTNNTMQSLTRVGALEQAAALSNLGRTRVQNQLAQTAIGQAQQQMDSQGSQQSEQQGQVDADKQQRLLTEANAALNDLISTTDPDQRQQKAQQWKAHFQQEGVPEDAIDNVIGGDPSDNTNLLAHQANIQRELATLTPGYKQAAANLGGPLANPITMAALGSGPNGLDVAPGLGLDAGIVAPYRAGLTQEATAGPVTAAGNVGAATTAGAVGQVAHAQAAGSAAGSGSVGSPPVAGARLSPDGKSWILPDGTLQAVTGAAQAGALGGTLGRPDTVTAPDGSIVHGGWGKDANGNWTFTGATLQTAPGATPTPAAGPSLASGTGLQAAAQANVQAAQGFEARAADVPTRKANLANLRQLAGEFSAGPQSGFWKNVGAIAAEYGLPVPDANLASDPTAAQEEFDKLSTAVLAAQRQTMGLPVTDQSVSITTGATPNEAMTPKGIERVLGVMEGNEDYINAERQAWQTWKDQGHGYETWAQFQPQWNRMFDPRVFQAQYMAPDEAAKVQSAIGSKYQLQEKALQRLGYIPNAQ